MFPFTAKGLQAAEGNSGMSAGAWIYGIVEMR
jgi:hypothetical protein